MSAIETIELPGTRSQDGTTCYYYSPSFVEMVLAQTTRVDKNEDKSDVENSASQSSLSPALP